MSGGGSVVHPAIVTEFARVRPRRGVAFFCPEPAAGAGVSWYDWLNPALARRDRFITRRFLPMLSMRSRLAVLGCVLLAAASPVAAADSMPAWAFTRDDQPLRERTGHLDKLGVDDWHAAGIRGKGVKVAVLDNGFRGWREQLGKSLPADVKVKTFRHDGNFEGRDSQHGILVGEVVHAIAPEAELIFANWESDEARFGKTVFEPGP